MRSLVIGVIALSSIYGCSDTNTRNSSSTTSTDNAQFTPGNTTAGNTTSGSTTSDATNGSNTGTSGGAEDTWPGPGPTGGEDASLPRNDGVVGIDDKPDGSCGYGSVYGVICSKAEQKYVNNAQVWIETTDCDGKPTKISTVSDSNGYYTLENVPSGTQTVHVKRDDFERTYSIIIMPGQLTDVTGIGHKECYKAIDCPVGSVTGYVCAPNGTLFVGGATIYVETTDCNGQPAKVGAVSNAQGNYTITGVPVGPQTIHVEKGSFNTNYVVTVTENGTVNAPDVVQNLCFPGSKTKIAVVTGHFDSIQDILTQLGIKYDLYDGTNDTTQAIAMLSDPTAMSQYDIIFFNCGKEHDEIMLEAQNVITPNLKNYVASGGSIYASDWAFVYAEWPWPSAINFLGGDLNLYGPKMGKTQKVTGTVADESLSGHLGKSSVAINYDEGLWAVMLSAAADVKIHIEGPIESHGKVPLMVSHTPGAGKVLYTTFHNEPQMTSDMKKILNFLVFEL